MILRYGFRKSVILPALLLHWSVFAGNPAASPASAVSPATKEAPAASKGDAAAGRFALSCAGCHSLAGVKLNGPDLTPATAWPLDQLKTAIKRMEKNVGPLPEAEIASLAELLKAPDVRDRIKAEQERIQAQFMSKMAPPDADIGRRLFLGTEPLRNGGLACAACHTAAGVGGNLGPDLTGIFAKVGGQTPLVSSIEQASFKVMAPHYRRHPVTKQEAMHLARYFSTLTPAQASLGHGSFVPAGGGIALAILIGMFFQLRSQRQNRGRDTKLQRRR
jgi:mono/diheme cytochrome c family protein